MRVSNGIGWNGYHQVPSHFILLFNIQTTEHNAIPSHTIPFHPIPPIQTKPKITKTQSRPSETPFFARLDT